MIITVGEAVVDFLPERNLDGARTFRPVLGGSAFNVALGLGRLGVPVGYVWALSSDLFGARFAEALEEADVDTDRIVFVDEPSTLAFVGIDKGEPHFDFFDIGSAGRQFDPADTSPLGGDVELVHCGSYVLGTEPIGSFVEDFISDEVEERLISLDLNIRPKLVDDEAAYRQRLTRMVDQADIVKASMDDIRWLYPGQPPEMVMEYWLEGGATIAIITRGDLGVHVATDDFVLSKPAHAVDVRDTLGAGDAFMAGFLAGLVDADVLTAEGFKGLNEDRLEHATILGQRVAAYVCTQGGADMPWRYEVTG
ncbi:carbohydrate kinase family protein [Rhodobium gokarnense]|uniref:Fructokinase n=1 Tax=Rhodobium gokarnense TaxID=364296 RepID=A0ABT3HAL8_9HYPH|nr:carbohydrate kinase [Rhodobium gokarnense]MCW2307449.1 fructokinase [Rhodobium gokarnense]